MSKRSNAGSHDGAIRPVVAAGALLGVVGVAWLVAPLPGSPARQDQAPNSSSAPSGTAGALLGSSTTGPEGPPTVPAPGTAGGPSGPGSIGSDGPAPEPAPELEESDRTDAGPGAGKGAGRDLEQAAAEVVATWARPDVPADRWWRELEPLLSAAAIQAYGYTDPSSLPRLRVGSARRAPAGSTRPDGTPVPAATSTYAVVEVTTSAGVVDVDMTRTSPAAGWVMDRMDLTEVLAPLTRSATGPAAGPAGGAA